MFRIYIIYIHKKKISKSEEKSEYTFLHRKRNRDDIIDIIYIR